MKEEARNRAPVERLVMQGEYKIKNYDGTDDFYNWEFGEEAPWLACEDDGEEGSVREIAIACLKKAISILEAT